jgi:hypothetical protein
MALHEQRRAAAALDERWHTEASTAGGTGCGGAYHEVMPRNTKHFIPVLVARAWLRVL